MELVLARPGVVSRCGFCNTLNRFVGATGESETLSAPVELAMSSEITAEPRDPIVLHQPSGERPAPPPAVLGDRETVVGVGSLHGDEGPDEPADGHATTIPATPPLREPSNRTVTPLHASLGPPLNTLAPPEEPPSLLANHIEGTAEFFVTDEPELDQQLLRRAVSGDRLNVVRDDDEAPPATSWGALPAQVESFSHTGGKVVPLRVSRQVRRVEPEGDRDPDPPAAQEPAPAVAGKRAPRTRSENRAIHGDYAAAKLADRLTMLIFTLVVIALLLAAILGVLVTQGAMKHFTRAALEESQGALDTGVDSPRTT
jgi:hypothetical protein